MKHCATCKYMAPPRDIPALTYYDSDTDTEYNSEHTTCTRILHGNGYTDQKRSITELACVLDGSGYAARLVVLPDFGCVLHEDK